MIKRKGEAKGRVMNERAIFHVDRDVKSYTRMSEPTEVKERKKARGEGE